MAWDVFFQGGKSLWDLLSRVAKNGMGVLSWDVCPIFSCRPKAPRMHLKMSSAAKNCLILFANLSIQAKGADPE